MSSEKIVFEADIGDDATEWYGTLVITNIRYKNESPVQIQKFLGIRFKAPPVSAELKAQTQLTPWQAMAADITTEKVDDDKAIRVSAKLSAQQSHVFQANDSITFGVNGNLKEGVEQYLASVELYADELPGEVEEGKEE